MLLIRADSGNHKKNTCSGCYTATVHDIGTATSVCAVTFPTAGVLLKLVLQPNVRLPKILGITTALVAMVRHALHPTRQRAQNKGKRKTTTCIAAPTPAYSLLGAACTFGAT